VIFPAIGFLTGAPLFGWANPVPVDSRNFKNPRRGMAVVAAAGPLSNLVMALIAAGLLALVMRFNGIAPLHYDFGGAGENVLTPLPGMLGAGIQMLAMAVLVNLFLAFFNILPIAPLDGARIVQAFVSHKSAEAMDRHAGVAQLILFGLIFFTSVGRYLAIPVFMVLDLIFRGFAIVG
jgi:Zn-dependent protease